MVKTPAACRALSKEPVGGGFGKAGVCQVQVCPRYQIMIIHSAHLFVLCAIEDDGRIDRVEPA